MSRSAGDRLTRSLLDDDVSSAWAVWSSAAESALTDACSFSGGPIPCLGLVLGRGLLGFVLFALVVPRFVRFVVMLLILLTVGTFICIVILLLPGSWIFGAALRSFLIFMETCLRMVLLWLAPLNLLLNGVVSSLLVLCILLLWRIFYVFGGWLRLVS